VSVANKGFVRSEREGETVVKVSDEANPDNFDQISIQVTPLQELARVQSRVAAKRNGGKTQLYPIAMD